MKNQTQQGAALIVALIFLVVMTIAGVTAMRFANIEEKLTGNSLIKGHNFQVANSELRAQLLSINTSLSAIDTLQKALAKPLPSDAEKAADPTAPMLPNTTRKSQALTAKVSNSLNTVTSSVRFLKTSVCPESSVEKFTCYTFELNSTAAAGNSQSWQSQGFDLALSK